MKTGMMMAAVAAVAMGLMAQEAPVAVQEEDSETGWGMEATADLFSAYVWRGCVYNDRPVFQPAAELTYATADYGTFGAGLWSNFDLTDRNRQVSGGGLNEIDYHLFYGIDVGEVSLEIGHYWYTVPRANGQDYWASTREVYVYAAYNNDLVTPFACLTYDYADYDGFYLNVGLNKEVSLSDQLTLGAEVSLGAGDDDYMAYVGTDDAGLMDFNAAVYADFSLTDSVSVGCRIAWMSLIDSDARDAEPYWDEDILWGGLSVSASF